MRDRGWRRKKDFSKAKRKMEINKTYYSNNILLYNNLHQYSKNKIHCSCPLCSAKTRNKGKRRKIGNYSPSINYKISEQRKINSMMDDLNDLLEDY